MGQGTHKIIQIIHEYELYKFKLDKFDCISIQANEFEFHGQPNVCLIKYISHQWTIFFAPTKKCAI